MARRQKGAAHRGEGEQEFGLPRAYIDHPLVERLRALLDDDGGRDVDFRTVARNGPNRGTRAHEEARSSSFLAMLSPMLHATLKHAKTGANGRKLVDLSKADECDTLSWRFLERLTTGHSITTDAVKLVNVARMADYLQIAFVKECVEEFLRGRLTPETCGGLYELATHGNMRELQQAALSHARNEFASYAQTDAFLALSSATLGAIIEDAALNVSNAEMSVYQVNSPPKHCGTFVLPLRHHDKLRPLPKAGGGAVGAPRRHPFGPRGGALREGQAAAPR